MLVLTRKQQEKIQIGENITITVLKMKGKTVRLGIEAPGSIPVLRGELADKQQAPVDRQAPIERQTFEAEITAVDAPASPNACERIERDPSWEAGADPRDTKVVAQRVPRSRVATVLPKMLDDRGPLRAMLDRRASVQI